ncbi:MAG: hypothetical protein HY923_06340 [Elusimicrobia bacterium]|nr:hypothetical protein [Elusimicrobiota bacterium]
MKRLMLIAVLSVSAGVVQAELDGSKAEPLIAQAHVQRQTAQIVGEWRKLPECRPGDGGRQNITSTMRILADHTAEAVIISYRGSDTSCAGDRIGRTVGTYTYTIDGPNAAVPGAFNTTWTVKTVKVTANNGDVWDRTDEFGGKVSRNAVKIVEQSGVAFYYIADEDSGWRLKSTPNYVRISR